MNFFERYKRIFFIIGFFGLVGVIGYALYSLFFQPLLPDVVVTEEVVTEGLPLPIADEGDQVTVEEPIRRPLPMEPPSRKPDTIAVGGVTQIRELTQTPALSPKMSSNGRNLNYYNKEEGRFYTLDENGELELLSNKQFFNVSNVEWSPTKKKAIIEYPDGANIIYNFDTNKQVTLPKHWEEFDFSASGRDIVSKSVGLDPDNRWIVTVKEDGSGAKKIEPFGINGDNMITSWSPNNQMAAMRKDGIDGDRQRIVFIGLNGENFRSTVIYGRGFEHIWSEDGEKLIYSAYSSLTENKPSLWSVGASGEAIGTNRKRLNVETWASKCSQSIGDSLYCAVPEDLPEGAGIFPAMAKTTVDRFYKINIKTGQKKLIAIPEQETSASSINVSRDEKFLYFIDNETEKINQIRLK